MDYLHTTIDEKIRIMLSFMNVKIQHF